MKLESCLALAGLTLLGLGARDAAPQAGHAAVVVGTFDSRAVAMAYVNSDAFRDYLRAQKEDVDRATQRAREFGDPALVAQLDALGPAMQKRIHEQGFATAPVDDILAHVADRLADVAARGGVDVIVSKWALTYQSPEADLVDVTDLLVAEFHPDAKTLKGIHELIATEPVAIESLDHAH